jgi:Ni,Fe-hydrogenase I cytochrome b subunit
MSNPNSNKRYYTIFLSLVFIALGGWKLWQKFIEQQEIATFQWILAIVLLILGVYQLIKLRDSNK